jgi:LmbE family N-acetylglucosaminyl deacetylase
MNVLVVAAHPDDEVLGCGGTIAKLSREGHAVYIAILGEGLTSRYTERESADQAALAKLHACSREAARLLGAADLSLHQFPDNRFDTVPLLKVVKLTESLISSIRPEVIYTHHAGDLNIDHVVTNRAVLTASRPLAASSVRDVYAFEIPSSTEWAFGLSGTPFAPNVFVSIGDTLQAKIAAMALYESEVRPFPFPRSAEALMAIARHWGSVAGLPSAEAFCLLRSIR